MSAFTSAALATLSGVVAGVNSPLLSENIDFCSCGRVTTVLSSILNCSRRREITVNRQFVWLVLEATEMVDRRSRLDYRTLLEQSGDHRRVEVGANSRDQSVSETDHPAVVVVKAHAVLGCR